MDLRIEFNKIGMIKFISHLDTIRLFSRAIKRAQIPIIWTEGFNPHMKMSIAHPLSLGIESQSEIMDIQVMDDYDSTRLKEELNEVLPKGIKVLQVVDTFDKESIFERLYSSQYELYFPKDISPPIHQIALSLNKFLQSEEICIERKRKKGKKKVLVKENIRDQVLEAQIREEEEGYVLRACLRAGSKDNLRPDRFLLGLSSFMEENMDIDLVQIRRVRSFDIHGSEIQP